MRRCPYCAEEIQDLAIICRFCGRAVKPVGRSGAAVSDTSSRANLPSQRWYSFDERIKSSRPPVDERSPERAPRRTSMWSKLGGLAADVFDRRATRPNRSGTRERITRRYVTLAAYQRDVARRVSAGWLIERQTDDADGAIEVAWVREP